MLRGLFDGHQGGSEEGAWVIDRVDLSLRGNEMGTPLEGLLYLKKATLPEARKTITITTFQTGNSLEANA